ncbi:MAG: glycosyltransferase family protein [Patescibacteria group bacterium]|nr:glycosyltransferase family protein [Patescibacteria group bacterium]
MPDKKIGIILQARMGSTRLPGKVMMKIQDKTVISLIVERLRRVKNADEIILATSIDPRNEGVVEEARRLGIGYFRGSEENVLDRLYQASKKFSLDAVVRITGDCPLIDPEVVGKGIDLFIGSKVDIVSNTIKRTFPHGLDFEVFTKDSLEKAWLSEKDRLGDGFLASFVNPTAYIKESGEFKHLDILNGTDLSKIRITLDYLEDLKLIEKIYQELYPVNPCFGLKEVLELLDKKPQLLMINKKYVEPN